MTIEWLRDLIIVIFGIAATLFVIAAAIIMFIVYRKVDNILGKVQRVMNFAEKNIIQPSMTLIQNVMDGFETVQHFFKRKKEEKAHERE